MDGGVDEARSSMFSETLEHFGRDWATLRTLVE